MNYWLICPKSEGSYSDVKSIPNNRVNMGWDDNDCPQFYSSVKKGDMIVVCSGAHFNNQSHFTGIASYLEEQCWFLECSTDKWNEEISNCIKSRPSDFGGGYSNNPWGPTKSIIKVGGNPAEMKLKSILDSIKSEMQMQDKINVLKRKKNLILQGAPGTGKTYATASIAVALCDGADKVPATHDKVMERYNELKNANQVEFCTFHQSMDYEDFVEGLKPKIINEKVVYDVEDGIFKDICNVAEQNYWDSKKNPQQQVADLQTRELFEKYCQHIEQQLSRQDSVVLYSKSKMRIRYVHRIKDGSAYSVQIAKDANSSTQGLKIDIVERDYDNFKKGLIKTYEDIKPSYDSKSHFHGNAIYYFELYKRLQEFEADNKIPAQIAPVKEKPYILIIDEINRGNVSKIFGELITLLEADKRIGSSHPVRLELPYSKEQFGVPQNLYIIGTMNTTDRSTGTIDYAIRRRFAFITLKSSKEAVEQFYGSSSQDIKKEAIGYFERINGENGIIQQNRMPDFNIDDLLVGHSYFMAKDAVELKNKIKYEVIPLIEEYIKDGIVKDNEEFEAFCKLF